MSVGGGYKSLIGLEVSRYYRRGGRKVDCKGGLD